MPRTVKGKGKLFKEGGVVYRKKKNGGTQHPLFKVSGQTGTLLSYNGPTVGNVVDNRGSNPWPLAPKARHDLLRYSNRTQTVALTLELRANHCLSRPSHLVQRYLLFLFFFCSRISHEPSQDDYLVFSEEVNTEIIQGMQTAEMVDHLIANNVFSSINDIKQRLDPEPSFQAKNALILDAVYQQVKSNEKVFDLFLNSFYAVHEGDQKELTARVFKGTT